MSAENAKEFLTQVLRDPDLKLKLQRARAKYGNKPLSDDQINHFIKYKIIPLAHQINLIFTEDEIREQLKVDKQGKLSDSDLEGISGGLKFKDLIITVGAISGISLLGSVEQSPKAYNIISNPHNQGFTEVKVQSGDSLWEIAASLLGDGNKFNEIIKANSLPSSTIRPGQVLKIPINSKSREFQSLGFTTEETKDGKYKLLKYNFENPDVVIPEGITHISSDAFRLNVNVKSIVMPDSVNIIDEFSFQGCTSLENITLSKNLKSINYAFVKCSSLKHIDIPDSVTSINGTFDECSSLSEINLPKSLKKIEYNTFNKCSSLTSVSLPESIQSIQYGAFQLCTSLKNITLPNSVSQIYSSAFKGCKSLEKIIIPESVEILEGAFTGCSNLKEIEINAPLSYIGSDAFAGCTSIQTVKLPDTVIGIEANAFSGCVDLVSINIPKNLRKIGEGAFNGCISLKNVILPKSIREIGRYAFYKCDKITSITVSRDISIGQYAFPRQCIISTVEADYEESLSVYTEKAHKFICECINAEKNKGTNFKECFGIVGDGVAKILNNYDNFSLLPKVVSEEEFQRISKGKTILYRGIMDSRTDESQKTIPAKKLADMFRYGEFFNGNGIFGNGTYTASSLSTAKSYSNNDSNSVILKMILDDNAKVVEYQDLSEIATHYQFEHIEYANSVKSGEYEDENRIKRLSDLGHLAESLNYDVIHVNKSCTYDSDYYIILNRGKVIVSEDNVPQEIINEL